MHWFVLILLVGFVNHGECEQGGDDASGECKPKEDVCVVKGRCYNEGDVDPGNKCKVCNPSTNNTMFVYKRDTEPACKVHGIQLTCTETDMTATLIQDVFVTNNVDISFDNCDDYTTAGDSISVKFADCVNSVREVGDLIVQGNSLIASMTDVTPPIRRELSYFYKLECRFNRNLSVSVGTPVVVQDEAKMFDLATVEKTQFTASMTLYESNLFTLELRPPFQFTAYEPIYIRIEAVNKNEVFKMVVQQCYATPTNDVSSLARYIFFDERCRLDPSFQEYDADSQHRYDFSIDAFKFIAVKGSVYLHCKLLICKASSNSDECRQKCHVTQRRRRSMSESDAQTAYVRSGTISYKRKPTCDDVTCTTGAHCIDLPPAHCRCNEGHVTDFRTQQCTNTSLVGITGVHLDINFRPPYADHSSREFVRLAITIEHQLATQFSLDYEFVKGVKVMKAREGSVVLDFLITHAHTKTPVEAYNSFVQTIMGDVIGKDGGVKHVPVIRGILPKMKRIEKVKGVEDSLLVVIVVVCVALVIVLHVSVTWAVVRCNRGNHGNRGNRGNSNRRTSTRHVIENNKNVEVFRSKNIKLVQYNNLDKS